MQVSSGGGDGGMHSELNVTPMIDVVLVLLIIFMVVTPIINQQVPLAIPARPPPGAPPAASAPAERVVIGLDATDRIRCQGAEVADLPSLRAAVRAALAGRTDRSVFLEAHPDASYAQAVQVMDTARSAGATQVGWVEVLP